MGIRDLVLEAETSSEVDSADHDEALNEGIPQTSTSLAAELRRVWGIGTLVMIAVALLAGSAFLMKHALPQAVGSVHGQERQTLEEQKGCCSWNKVDCGHRDERCQSGALACAQCEGTWGNFVDRCAWGHPPAPPLPTIWPYRGKDNVKVTVLSLNLERSVGSTPAKPWKDAAYDFVGFQGCSDAEHVLRSGGVQRSYETVRVKQGVFTDICVAWKNATWQVLSSGTQEVALDANYGAYVRRHAMWVRARHTENDEVVFFVNHLGPLPVNSGGTAGGPATASALLDVVVSKAERGDAVIMVGDFNAERGSLTVRQLECKLSHVAWGEGLNSTDNVFANVRLSHVANGRSQTLNRGGGGLSATIDLSQESSQRQANVPTSSADISV